MTTHEYTERQKAEWWRGGWDRALCSPETTGRFQLETLLRRPLRYHLACIRVQKAHHCEAMTKEELYDAMREIVKGLLHGIEVWTACECGGIPDEVYDAVAKAEEFLGEAE